MKRVLVTGLGALTPIGNDLETYWQNLINGTSGAGMITKFDTSNHKTKIACELKQFNILDYLDKKEARILDPFCQYALIAVQEAVNNGLINFNELNRDRIGVIWATGNGGIKSFEEEVMEYCLGDGVPRFNPYFMPRILCDTSSGIISIKHQLHGINFNTISACASSTSAMIDAFNYIRWGKAEMIITGGSEAPITKSGIAGFNALKALSTRNEDPDTASRPFDVDRDGFVMGEGAGAIILEEYEHAIRRGAVIFGEMVGGGISADAYHMTATHPDGYGAILGMKNALEDAEIDETAINYLNMHATSTGLGDLSEIKAVNKLFGDVDKFNISATKSMTGHLLGAAGAIEAIACIMSTKEDVVPPTINLNQLDPLIDTKANLTINKAQNKKIDYAMSNTFGFGGHNATAIFKKFKN